MLTYLGIYGKRLIRTKIGEDTINKETETNNGLLHLSLKEAKESNEMLVGLSLSACVGDIAAGTIPEEKVSIIIANTCASNEEEFSRVINDYRRIVWIEFPDEAEDIARRMWKKGLIEQPRVKDRSYIHYIVRGRWIELKNIAKIQMNNCI